MEAHHDLFARPAWLEQFAANVPPCPDTTARMRLAIRLSRLNVEHRTGGPFGAVVVETGTGRVLGAGVNVVVQANSSLAHAEMVALAAAQSCLGSYDLASAASGGCVLASSSEPCAMCLGAIQWSGVSSLSYGARDEDIRRIGFDEGIKPADWQSQFEACGITVKRDVLRAEAVKVLDDYRNSGGIIYNPSRAKT